MFILKQKPVLVLSLFIAASCITAFSKAQQQSAFGPMTDHEQTIVTILHTNDMHGSYMPFQTTKDNATAQTGDAGRDTLLTFSQEAPIGGFAYLAGAIQSIREKKGADKVLLLDGGDTFSDDQLGNLTEGEAMIRLMNRVGYDLMALGNHDFDYGMERTRELQQLAAFPMRAANILDESTQQPLFGDPYIIAEKDNVKIGILALGYHNTPKTGNPENVRGLQFTNGPEVARKYIPELQQQADIIIVLSHEGTAVDELIARAVQGIDLIIGAHSHDLIAPPKKINQTYVVQALSDAAVLGETELIITGTKLTDVKSNCHMLWHEQWQADEEIQQLIEVLRNPHLSKLQEKVAECRDVIGRQYKSESPFDKLVGNLLLEAYTAEVALMPGVGYGISLQGTVTSEDIYKLLPHPSKIVTLSMTGLQLIQTLEQTAENLKPAHQLHAVGGLLQTSGIVYEMDLTKPVGQRIGKVRIGNAPLEEKKLYQVVTHSGMLTGLHNYNEIGKGQHINRTGKILTEFVIEQLRAKQEVIMPDNLGEVTIRK